MCVYIYIYIYIYSLPPVADAASPSPSFEAGGAPGCTPKVYDGNHDDNNNNNDDDTNNAFVYLIAVGQGAGGGQAVGHSRPFAAGLPLLRRRLPRCDRQLRHLTEGSE